MLLEALWLLHINFLFKFSIDECMGDIDGMEVEILDGSKSQNKSNGCLACSRSKDLCIIKPRTLTETLGHKTSLVALNRAICMTLDLVNPTRSNSLLARRKFNNLPSLILKMHKVLLF